MSISFGSLSGQFMVIRNSAFISTAPVFAVGLISENAINTINVRPSTTLNSMSVNGTKVPSSLGCRKSDSSIAVPLEHRDDVDFGHFRNRIDEIGNAHAEKVILKLQHEGGANTGHG